eukprot:SAG31_NODE_730_length_12505_cov_3.807109_4_plen_94_part_00
MASFFLRLCAQVLESKIANEKAAEEMAYKVRTPATDRVLLVHGAEVYSLLLLLLLLLLLNCDWTAKCCQHAAIRCRWFAAAGGATCAVACRYR